MSQYFVQQNTCNYSSFLFEEEGGGGKNSKIVKETY